jgi:ribonuclease-3
LEFLGDSILSYLVSEYLYKKFADLPEGELTNLRSSVVKTATLASIAKSLNLGDCLFLSRGEEESGGRGNPSLLADTFEALLGAIYLDLGLSAVVAVLNKFLFPLLPKIMKEKSYKDDKSTFQELVQEVTKFSPIYKVLREEGPDHAKKFTVGVYVGNNLWGEGNGKSKHEAEQVAATSALEKWRKKDYNNQ